MSDEAVAAVVPVAPLAVSPDGGKSGEEGEGEGEGEGESGATASLSSSSPPPSSSAAAAASSQALLARRRRSKYVPRSLVQHNYVDRSDVLPGCCCGSAEGKADGGGDGSGSPKALLCKEEGSGGVEDGDNRQGAGEDQRKCKCRAGTVPAPVVTRGGVPSTFPLRLHRTLQSLPSSDLAHVAMWQPHGRAFVVRSPAIFASDVLPRYFGKMKFSSFQRQLNLYGFKRLSEGRDKGGYYHEYFLRGREYLCWKINRMRIKGNGRRGACNPDQEPDFYAMTAVDAYLPPSSSSSSSEQPGSPEQSGSPEPTTTTGTVDLLRPRPPKSRRPEEQEASASPREGQQLKQRPRQRRRHQQEEEEAAAPDFALSSLVATSPPMSSGVSEEFPPMLSTSGRPPSAPAPEIPNGPLMPPSFCPPPLDRHVSMPLTEAGGINPLPGGGMPQEDATTAVRMATFHRLHLHRQMSAPIAAEQPRQQQKTRGHREGQQLHVTPLSSSPPSPSGAAAEKAGGPDLRDALMRHASLGETRLGAAMRRSAATASVVYGSGGGVGADGENGGSNEGEQQGEGGIVAMAARPSRQHHPLGPAPRLPQRTTLNATMALLPTVSLSPSPEAAVLAASAAIKDGGAGRTEVEAAAAHIVKEVDVNLDDLGVDDMDVTRLHIGGEEDTVDGCSLNEDPSGGGGAFDHHREGGGGGDDISCDGHRADESIGTAVTSDVVVAVDPLPDDHLGSNFWESMEALVNESMDEDSAHHHHTIHARAAGRGSISDSRKGETTTAAVWVGDPGHATAEQDGKRNQTTGTEKAEEPELEPIRKGGEGTVVQAEATTGTEIDGRFSSDLKASPLGALQGGHHRHPQQQQDQSHAPTTPMSEDAELTGFLKALFEGEQQQPQHLRSDDVTKASPPIKEITFHTSPPKATTSPHHHQVPIHPHHLHQQLKLQVCHCKMSEPFPSLDGAGATAGHVIDGSGSNAAASFARMNGRRAPFSRKNVWHNAAA